MAADDFEKTLAPVMPVGVLELCVPWRCQPNDACAMMAEVRSLRTGGVTPDHAALCRGVVSVVAAVTFDVWETLITDPPDLSQARSATRIRQMVEALARSGRLVAESDLSLAYERSWEEYERYWEKNLDISTAEQLEILLGLVDPTLLSSLDVTALGSLSAAYVNPVFDFPPQKKDGLPDVLRELKRRGCKVGLICNTGRTPGWAVRQLLATYGLLDYFDAVAFSNEERIRKPAAEIFQRVLTALGVPAQQTVHVGDNLVTDVAGAKSVGMKAILIGPSVGEAPLEADARITSLPDLIPTLAELKGI